MSDTMILLKGTLKVIKYFFPVVVVFIFGLACIYIDERRERMKAATALDLKYNIAAMYIAILRDDIATPEQAFAVIEDKSVRKTVTDEDVEDMVAMKEQGLSYGQISEIYGLSWHATRRRIERYKKRTSQKKLSEKVHLKKYR